MSKTLSRADVDKSMATVKAIWQPTADPFELMTSQQLAVQIDSLRQSLARLEAIKTCCHSCVNFELERCNLHKAAIPIEFQREVGVCGDWVYDGVPF